jgi:hypothetical protein
MCWAGRGRKKSGRENINYRQYKPLQGEDDDPEAPAIREGSSHSRGGGSTHGTDSAHGNSNHGNSAHGNGNSSSKHGASTSSHGKNASSHGMSTHGKGGGNSVHGMEENNETVNMLHTQAGTAAGAGTGSNFQPVNASREQYIQQRGKIELVGMEMSDSEYESTDDEGFSIAAADVNHEKGTWLHTFMRR